MKRLMTLVMGLMILLPIMAVAATIHVPTDQPTIQAGINAAADGDTVLVAPGTYLENLLIQNKGITLLSSDGRTNTKLKPILPATGLVAYTLCSSKVNVFKGFTLANVSDASTLYAESCFVCVLDNRFTSSQHMGDTSCGTATLLWGNYVVKNNVFDSNQVGDQGGGVMLVSQDSSLVEGNVFIANFAKHGAGIAVKGLKAVIRCNLFVSNTALGYGGAIVLYNSDDCMAYNNTIDSCKSLNGSGGGISFCLSSNGAVFNNIVTYCTGYSVWQGYCSGNCAAYNNCYAGTPANYSDITAGIGSISSDPQFMGGVPFDYQLRPTSPCIDAGDPDPQYNDPDGTRNDIGAFYHTNSPPSAPQLRLPLAEGTVPSQHPNLIIRNSTDADFDTSQVQYPSVIPTGEWTDFVSLDMRIDDDPAPVGTVVDAFDPQGVHCGHFVTSQPGIMGPLYVFGDDLYTPSTDEGCVMGDTVVFRINSVLATTSPPDSPTWRGAGPYKMICLAAPARDSLLYTFEVSPDNFAATVFTFTKKQDADSLTTLVVDSILIENTQYWWRVMASDYYESSEYSPAQSFDVDATNTAPTAVSLTQPTDTVVKPITIVRPLFVWTPATDPDPLDTVKYDLVIAIDSNFVFVQQISNLTATSHTLTTDLLWGKRYWWKVKSIDRHDAFNWSPVSTFRTMTLGDANNDGAANISDAVYLIAYIFSGGLPPNPYSAGDANCNGTVNISDAVYLIAYIFSGGPAPCAAW